MDVLIYHKAEAISDIITAKNSYASSLALKGIQGSISHFIKDLKEDFNSNHYANRSQY